MSPFNQELTDAQPGGIIEKEETNENQDNAHNLAVAHRLRVHPLNHSVQPLVHLDQSVRGEDEQDTKGQGKQP